MKTIIFKLLLIGTVVVALFNSVQAQENSGHSVDSITHIVLPTPFYLPETSLGLGLTGILTWRRGSDAPINRPSVISCSAAYTLKNQLLFYLPYEFYSRDQKMRIKGELGYYRYFYNFYGLGSETKQEELENYNVNFPRFELNVSKTHDYHFYYGAGIKFDQFDITEVDSSGILYNEKPLGSEGGRKLNMQFLLTLDYRDNIISTYKGFFAELKYEFALPGVVSNFNYNSLSIDIRKFIMLKPNTILAMRLLSRHASSGTPFFDQPYVSNPSHGRGFSDRRFIARNITIAQLELRFPIIGRLSGVAYYSSNFIYSGNAFAFEQSNLKNAYGSGLRYTLNKRERTTIRMDVARGGGQLNFYFTSSQAF